MIKKTLFIGTIFYFKVPVDSEVQNTVLNVAKSPNHVICLLKKTLCDGVTTEIINIYLKLKSIEISLAQNLFQTNI